MLSLSLMADHHDLFFVFVFSSGSFSLCVPKN